MKLKHRALTYVPTQGNQGRHHQMINQVKSLNFKNKHVTLKQLSMHDSSLLRYLVFKLQVLLKRPLFFLYNLSVNLNISCAVL